MLAWVLTAIIMISSPDVMLYAEESISEETDDGEMEEIIVVGEDESGMSAEEEPDMRVEEKSDMSAEEESDISVKPADADKGIPFRRAAETAGKTIDMKYTYYVFANGVPIVIRETDNGTGIFDEEGNLLSGDVDVSTRYIYGGWYDGDNKHTANTSIVMESGTVQAIYGGSFQGTLNGSTSVIVNGGTAGFIYGGGNQSVVTDGTEVIFNGGSVNWLFGGGYQGSIASTHVRVQGTPDNPDSVAQICGGSYGGNTEKAVLEIRGTDGSSDSMTRMALFGGGWNDRVEEAEIIIDENCSLETVPVYGCRHPEAQDNTSTVGSVHFRVSLTQKENGMVPRIDSLNGYGVEGKASVSFKGIGEVNYDYATNLNEIDDVSVENCKIALYGAFNETDRKWRLNLGRLYMASSGTVTIPVTLASASVGELAGSGTVIFSAVGNVTAEFPGVEVGKITASASLPVKIGRTGANMTDERWERLILFHGKGVEELESASCFVSTLDRYIILKTEDNTIQVGKGDERIQAYLDPPLFDKKSYRYGDIMTVTLGLYAQNQPVPGASVEICAGKVSPYTTIASVITDENGRATVSLPVNDALWDSCQHGLLAIFWGNDKYKQNFYALSLDGGSGTMSFEVQKAAITLQQEIPAPKLNEVPAGSLDGEESDFYTAQIVWTPSNAVFLPNTAYKASIRLVPETGYSLDPGKIESITYQGAELPLPERTETDGSLLLKDVAVFEAISAYEVIFSASSFEGVTGASGAGVYFPGDTVTIDAGSREGYVFAGWSASEGVSLADASLSHTTFVMPERDVLLKANWKEAGSVADTYKVIFEPSSLEGVEGASGEGAYAPGTEVTIDAGRRQGCTFAGWSVPEGVVLADASLSHTTFVMPEKDVILTLNWKKNEYGDVLPGDVPANGRIPQGLWTAGVEESYVYTGAAIKPPVRVYDYNKRLTEKKDYTVSYRNNKIVNDASNPEKAPTVLVKGKGNYKDTDTVVFAIRAVNLNDDSITAEDMTVAYNKKVQKKVPAVLFCGKKLSFNKDFTVSYCGMEKADAFKACGEYEILLTGKGNYTGSKTVKFTITDKNLIQKASVKRIPNEAYDGNEKKPQLTVSEGKKRLAEGVDYRAEYRNNVEVGTATVLLIGTGDYAGTKKVSFKITGTSIKGVSVDKIKNCIYNGAAQEPDVVVRMGDKILVKGTDYELEYYNNKNVGTAGFDIKGIHAYTGTVRKTFRIEACDLTESLKEQLDKNIAVRYRKGGSRPSPELVFGSIKLAEGKDYTITCRNNKAVTMDGTRKKPSFTVKGKGNFKGTFTKEFTITEKALNDDTSPVKLTVADKAYVNRAGGYMSKPVLTDVDGRKLSAGRDYDKNIVYTRADGTVLTKQDKIEAEETVRVKVAGMGAYTGSLKAEYRITQKDFRKAKIVIPAQAYTGKEVTLKEEDITVKVGKDVLAPGTDYEIVEGSYVNHVRRGRASVTIKGKGNYGGMKTVKFRIGSRKMAWFVLP